MAFSFKGRINRLTYWVWSFLKLPVYVILAGVSDAVEESFWLLLLLCTPILLAILYAETAMAAKRLHDTGRSGWSQLWGLVPIIGGLQLFIVCGFFRDREPNKYGDPPKSIVIPLIKEFLSGIPLIPKSLWRFTLNRVRELGKAFRDED